MSGERVSWLAHRGLPIQDPLTSGQLDEIVAHCPLRDDDFAVDFGCGSGELLARLVERWDCGGLGIDRSPIAIERARLRAPSVRWRVGNATDHGLLPDVARWAGCVGATHAFDGLHATIDALVDVVAPGGFVVVGEGYWRTDPSDDWLARLGAARDELSDRADVVTAFERAGLTLVHAVDASSAEMDAYNDAWRANLEAHLGDHPDDEEVRVALADAASWHADCGQFLGFGVFVAVASPA